MARRTGPKLAPKIEREQRELECVLSEAETLQRGDSMAEAELAIETLKLQRKGINGQIADHGEARHRLAVAIETGKEKRQVQCTWTADYARGVTTCTRDDTGEVVEQRPLTAEDRQQGFAVVTGGDADDADPGDPPADPAPPTPRAGRRGDTHHEYPTPA